MQANDEFELSFLLVQEENGWWSAQCLEYDFAVQAKQYSDLNYEIERIITAHATLNEQAGQEPFHGIPPAPQELWDMYKRSTMDVPAKGDGFPIPKPLHGIPPRRQFRVAEPFAA